MSVEQRRATVNGGCERALIGHDLFLLSVVIFDRRKRLQRLERVQRLTQYRTVYLALYDNEPQLVIIRFVITDLPVDQLLSVVSARAVPSHYSSAFRRTARMSSSARTVPPVSSSDSTSVRMSWRAPNDLPAGQPSATDLHTTASPVPGVRMTYRS